MEQVRYATKEEKAPLIKLCQEIRAQLKESAKIKVPTAKELDARALRMKRQIAELTEDVVQLCKHYGVSFTPASQVVVKTKTIIPPSKVIETSIEKSAEPNSAELRALKLRIQQLEARNTERDRESDLETQALIKVTKSMGGMNRYLRKINKSLTNETR